MSGHRAPSPPGLPVLGHLLAFRRDVLGLLLDAHRRCGDVVRFRLGPVAIHLVAHPDGIRQVLQERAEAYDKRTRSSAKIQDLTGLGLLTASGELWRRQRRLIQPGFRPGSIAGFVPVMEEATDSMLHRWQARGSEPFDVASEMMRLAFEIAGRTLFGAEVAGDAGLVEDSMSLLLADTYRRLERIVDLPLPFPTSHRRRIEAARATLDRVVYGILAARRAMPPEERPLDLLSILLAERDAEDGSGMSDEQLRNETLTLLLAGHETTANALAWTFYLLARHPEIAARVREEASSSDACIDDHTLTRNVIQEAMRLYPPIWAIERRAVDEDEIAGFRIPAGSTVVVSPWVTHRHPAFWEEPERFDPSRFDTERSASRPTLAYLPFGAGPRFCIGAHFAMAEASVIVSRVLRRFALALEPGRSVEPQAGITLRARGGVWVRAAAIDP